MQDVTPQEIQPLARMSDAEQENFIAAMRPEDVLKMDASFETWAQRGQIPPSSEGWRVWLMMAGRGFGKTRAGAEWIHRLAMSAPKRRIALVGATLDEARDVLVEGQSGVMAVALRHGMKLTFSGRTVKWPNGSRGLLYSGDSPEGLRGPEHHFAWAAAPDRHRGRGGGGKRRDQRAARQPR